MNIRTDRRVALSSAVFRSSKQHMALDSTHDIEGEVGAYSILYMTFCLLQKTKSILFTVIHSTEDRPLLSKDHDHSGTFQ